MRHKENLTNRINKARGCYVKYYHSIWTNIDLEMKLFDSLIISDLMYILETIPWKKTFEERIRTFVVKCYKQILNIHSDIRVQEKDLIHILDVRSISCIWRKKRMTAVNYIARLPYENPARIVLYRKPIYIYIIYPLFLI